MVLDPDSNTVLMGCNRGLLLVHLQNLWYTASELLHPACASTSELWQVTGLGATFPGKLFNGEPKPFMSASLLRGAQSRVPVPYVHSTLLTSMPPAPLHHLSKH